MLDQSGTNTVKSWQYGLNPPNCPLLFFVFFALLSVLEKQQYCVMKHKTVSRRVSCVHCYMLKQLCVVTWSFRRLLGQYSDCL